MAGERINLASLELDVQGLLTSASNGRKAIDELRAANKALAEQGDKNSAQYIRNEAEISRLNREVRGYTTAIQAQVAQSGQLVSAQEAINQALNETIVTENQAMDNNRRLKQLRRDLDVTSADYADTLARLNQRIDENDALTRSAASAREDQIRNIGDYKNAIVEAANELNIFNGGFSGFLTRSREAGGVGPLVATSFAAIRAGIVGATQAGLAFIATPLGATIAAIAVVVGLIVGAFNFMTSSMRKTEEGSNRLDKALSGFNGILKSVFQVVKPLSEFLFNVFLSTLEALGSAAEAAAEGVASLLDLVGLDDAAESVRNGTEAIRENVKAANDLSVAEAELQKQQRLSEKVQLDYQKAAEKLRQVRDDDARSIPERIKANEELGRVLEQQAEAELRIANKALQVADLRIKAEGATTEALDARAEALTKISDIQERISGQESEQLVNRNSLLKEGADLQKEIEEKRETALKKRLQDYANLIKSETDLYLSQQALKDKGFEDEIQQNKELHRRKMANAEAEYKASDKTAADLNKLNTERNNINLEFIEKQRDLVVANADKELEAIRNANKSKLDSNKFLTDEAVKLEQERLQRVLDAEKDNAAIQLENKKIDQQQYNNLVSELDTAFYQQNQEIQQQRRDAERERELADLENKKIIAGENFLAQLALDAEQAEIKREQEIAEAEKTGADIGLIDAKYVQMEKERAQALKDFKYQQNAQLLSGLKGLFSEQSKIGKALAVAEIINNTTQNASKAFTQAALYSTNPLTAALAPNAYAQGAIIIATGAANVAKTVGAKFEKGGLQEIGGNRHAQGGTVFTGTDGTRFEAEKGELIGVMNRNAARHFMAFNNTFPSGGVSASNYLAGGGIVAPASNTGGIDVNDLALVLTGAIAQMPTPVVAVEDIIGEVNSKVKVVNNANF